jgi:hypothetical protein
LPLIDLLIVIGWTSLLGAGLLKAVQLTTHYRPRLLGMGPQDFVLLAGICLLFSLALAARTWVKQNELAAHQRRALRTSRGEELDEGMPLAQRHAAADRR